MSLAHETPRVAMWVLLLILLVVVPGRSAGAAAHDSQCPRWRSAFLGMPTRPLVVQTSTNHRISMSVKLAATDEARWAGFQCAAVEEIWTTVILFDFGTEVPGTFHMRNVPGPLDIAFAKESGRIFSILRMDPSTTKEYGPMEPFRYAIEARTGFFKEKGIAPGHSMLLGKSN